MQTENKIINICKLNGILCNIILNISRVEWKTNGIYTVQWISSISLICVALGRYPCPKLFSKCPHKPAFSYVQGIKIRYRKQGLTS